MVTGRENSLSKAKEVNSQLLGIPACAQQPWCRHRTSAPRVFGWLGKFKQHGDKPKRPDQSDRTMKPREGADMSIVVKSNRNHTEGPVKYSRGYQTVICVKITRRGVRSWDCLLALRGRAWICFKRLLLGADIRGLGTIFWETLGLELQYISKRDREGKSETEEGEKESENTTMKSGAGGWEVFRKRWTSGQVVTATTLRLKGEPALSDNTFKVWPREWVAQLVQRWTAAEATRSRDEKPRLPLRTSKPPQGMAALRTEKQSQEQSSVSLGGSWRHPHSWLVPMLWGSETGRHHVSVVYYAFYRLSQ